jgi:hypothetical protein
MEQTTKLLQSPRVRSSRLGSRPGTAAGPQLIDGAQRRGRAGASRSQRHRPARRARTPAVFLREVKLMGERTPTDEEIAVAKEFLDLLTTQTREDYLRSTDELLAQVPTEFQARLRLLEDAEAFIYLAAAGDAARVVRRVDENWDLVHAVDVRARRCRPAHAARPPAHARPPFPSLPQRDGHTALHAAAAMNHSSVVAALLSKGAKPNSQDWEGFTPLHWAVENGAVECVDALLAHGADPTVRNSAGATVLDVAGALKGKAQAAILALLRPLARAPSAEAAVAVGAGARV